MAETYNYVVINEGIRTQEIRTCLLCKGKGKLIYKNLRDRLFNVPGKWNLIRCLKCGLVWLTPRPIPDDTNKLYVNYYTHKLNNSSSKPLANLCKSLKANILRANFGYSREGSRKLLVNLLRWIGPLKEIVEGDVLWLKPSDGKYLLDVGCGNGQFMAEMSKLGWKVIGIEPDEEAARIVRERFGFKVLSVALEEAKFPDDSFDVITINHVIEHVYDPLVLLAECYRVLKPDGKLVVVTPNINSLGRWLFGKAWRGWEPPRHLFLFKPQTLYRCITCAGFKILKLYTPARAASTMWMASYIICRDGTLNEGFPLKFNISLLIQGLMFQGLEYVLSRLINVGEEILLIATK